MLSSGHDTLHSLVHSRYGYLHKTKILAQNVEGDALQAPSLTVAPLAVDAIFLWRCVITSWLLLFQDMDTWAALTGLSRL